MSMTEEKLKSIVNKSGFPLQIGLEHQINARSGIHGWRVLYKEHSWKNADTSASGFIDLVLVDHYGTTVMVVECKRVQNSHWIFLLSDRRHYERRHLRAWVSRYDRGKTFYFGWTDINADYPTYESDFCVVPGQDNKSRPMLERVAAEVIEASEALAKEEYHFLVNKIDYIRFYVNVIVTTAELNVCKFNPENISVDTGEIDETQFETVPYLRFRKSLSTKTVEELNLKEVTPQSLTAARENTIFIVNSKHLTDFLSKFEIDGYSFDRFKLNDASNTS